MTGSIRERALDLFPGGVNSPVRAYLKVGGRPPALARGKGSHVWDADGREYVDWIGAFGPLVAGHAHPSVLAAIGEAIGNGGPFAVTGEAEVRLAEEIRRRMPAVERLRFVNSGTEAAMSALRVARAATGRDLVVKFAGGYHGHADHLLVRAGSGVATLGLPGSAGVPSGVAAHTLVAAFNDLESVDRQLEAHAGRVAAVIVEPVAANSGVIPPAAGFLEGLRERCDGAGALLVFDEVITGFRVGPGGAQERYQVRPDLTVLGKVIGGGLPVGAYGGRADLMELVAPVGPVYQAGTLSGHPAVMAAGLATLSLLDAAAYERLEATGAELEAGLRGQGEVTRVGSLVGFVPPDFAAVHARLLAAGVLVPPAVDEAWFVSTAHSSDDIRKTLEGLR